jgi:hypothetical protein
LGGIYILQPLPSRWLVLLAMDTPDSRVAHWTGTVHCSVRATSAHHLGFGADDRWNPLSCSCTGQSVPHQTCPMRSDFFVLTFAEYYSLLQLTVGARLPLLRWLAGYFRCTSDSPVNYSGARLEETREWLVGVLLGLVDRTLSDAPFQHTLKSCSKYC